MVIRTRRTVLLQKVKDHKMLCYSDKLTHGQWKECNLISKDITSFDSKKFNVSIHDFIDDGKEKWAVHHDQDKTFTMKIGDTRDMLVLKFKPEFAHEFKVYKK